MIFALLVSFALAAAPTGPPPTEARVLSVYDGDTFTLETGDKIRLKWVNTPELRPKEAYGEEAKELTQRLIQDERVKLIMDGPNPRDSYGRVVAGATTASGKDLSLELIRAGLGHLFIIPPDTTDLSAHLAAQGEARAAKRGIWSTESYLGVLHMTSFHANAAGDDNTNVNGEYMRVCNISVEPVELSQFRMMTRDGRTFALPKMIVPAGHTVSVRSGKGSPQDDPRFQLEAFLGSDTPIWADDYDVATIVDAEGRTVDQRGSK
jgi:endonuclease YncB( thermonuclease family)